MGNSCEIVEYNVEVLQRYEHEKERVVSDGLEKFKELEMGMTFKTIEEPRQDGKSATFKVKTLMPKHTCGDSFVNPLETYHTLAVYFKDEVLNNPKYPIKDMRGILEKKFKLNVLRSKLKRAKTMALDKLEGSFKDDYNRLEAYGQELRQSKPGSDVVINISKDALEQGIRRFLRMYICFKALKDGWKSLRPIIGLDGTFLKGKCKGQLLVVVGQDSMNHFYPIAWAVVEKENTGTWTWFIQLLRISLELKNGEIVTFMSDMQKGLFDVVANVVPEAHHRLCVRHIESNWCKKWRSGEEKKLMWWCAWSTYEEEFKDTLKVLGKVDEDSASDLLHFPKKPIIKMLEEIRVKVMNMLVKNEKMGRKWQNDISPTVMKLYNDYRLMATNGTVEFNGDYGYEVKDGDTDTHTVNLELKKCICRLWDLGGIPCHHTIKAILHKKTEPLEEHKLQPVRGSQFWKIDHAQAMEPPKMVKLVGRPKMKRNKETDEASLRKGAWKQSRKGTLMRCNKCGDFNHNAKGCYKTKQSTAYGPKIGNDEDPALRPMVIFETETRMEKRSRIFEGIGSRKIVF
ncbi:uncharacterized protein [Solanum tuberosum]|uniref:uncharacterized protein n=1 Tax=Solanum tuberosum TaxID=4113 RepID=UPI00073A441A|nr:PREDICTED: uncharacterized protein LOC107061079 [Solanum tuberosum]